MLGCSNEDYQNWWPGTHLQFHTTKRYPDNIGNIVYMDEFIGKRRVKMEGIVIDAVSGQRIVWQMKKWGILLPVWLDL